jgi:hypothetical protein
MPVAVAVAVRAQVVLAASVAVESEVMLVIRTAEMELQIREVVAAAQGGLPVVVAMAVLVS